MTNTPAGSTAAGAPPSTETEGGAPEAAEPLAPGIYFGLPAERYHSDTAIGSSDRRRLYKYPPKYWYMSALNPDRPAQDTGPQAYGRAFHTLLLEGEDAFAARYAEAPEQSDYEGLLVNMNDIRAWLGRKGDTAASKKADAIHQVRAHSKTVPVWDQILDDFAAMCARSGREAIARTEAAQMRAQVEGLRDDPAIDAMFGAGVAEVTVVWKSIHGVRLKARIDWLRTKAVIDLKTTREPPFDMDFEKHCFNEIARHRYDMQAAHLIEARDAMPFLIADGLVFGPDADDRVPSRDWLRRLAAEGDPSCVLLFYATQGIPETFACEFTGAAQAIRELGAVCNREAVENYLAYMNRFGPDRPWKKARSLYRVQWDDLPEWM